MRGFVELTNGKTKVLLPVGSFEVYGGTKTGIQPCGLPSEDGWACEESYDEVKELIQAAQEPKQELKRRFIQVENIDGIKVLIEVSRVGVVDDAYAGFGTRIFDLLGDGLKDYWLVSESVEEVNRLIKEAQEG